MNSDLKKLEKRYSPAESEQRPKQAKFVVTNGALDSSHT